MSFEKRLKGVQGVNLVENRKVCTASINSLRLRNSAKVSRGGTRRRTKKKEKKE